MLRHTVLRSDEVFRVGPYSVCVAYTAVIAGTAHTEGVYVVKFNEDSREVATRACFSFSAFPGDFWKFVDSDTVRLLSELGTRPNLSFEYPRSMYYLKQYDGDVPSLSGDLIVGEGLSDFLRSQFFLEWPSESHDGELEDEIFITDLYDALGLTLPHTLVSKESYQSSPDIQVWSAKSLVALVGEYTSVAGLGILYEEFGGAFGYRWTVVPISSALLDTSDCTFE